MLLINSITYSVCPHVTVKHLLNTNNKLYFIAQLHAKQYIIFNPFTHPMRINYFYCRDMKTDIQRDVEEEVTLLHLIKNVYL